MRLKGRVAPVEDLTQECRREMFALMQQYYENIDAERFAADLAEKQWVILLEDPATGNVRGFSTQMVFKVRVGVAGRRREVAVLFSGDTIIEESSRGDVALSHVWGGLALQLMDWYEAGELYWFLISKGYKTYRFLPVFFREFYPRHDVIMPTPIRAVRDACGRAKFGDAYDAASGIVRAWPGKDRLREGVAEITPERLLDEDIRFFAESNPGHAAGDELCCLTPLTRENFTPAAWRVIHAGGSVSRVPAGRERAAT